MTKSPHSGKALGRVLVVLVLIAIAILLAKTVFRKEYPPMSLEEAQRLKFRVSVGGVAFDVPVNYHHHDYEMLGQWPRPPDGHVENKERTPVDYIRVYALLPDMAGYTADNAIEFDTPGWGRKVSVSMTDRHRADWKYYFDLVGPHLQRLDDSDQVLGMQHYFDKQMKHDVYLSYDHPRPDLIQIICDKPEPGKHPSCKVTTRYMEDRFQLEYAFGLPFFMQWQDIDRKLKTLLDQFAAAAKQHP